MLLLFVFCVVAGVWLVRMAGREWTLLWRLYREGTVAQGTVVAVRQQSAEETCTTLAFETSSGETVRFQDACQYPNLSLGDRAKVLYLPADPAASARRAGVMAWISLCVLTVVAAGTLFAVVPLAAGLVALALGRGST